MDLNLIDQKIKIYKNKIKHLDRLANRLPESEQAGYQAARRRFEQRLEAWQRTLGSDLAVFNSNIAEGYHELEGHLTRSMVTA